MKVVAIGDHVGRSWLVFENDTAWPLISRLAKQGVHDVVLPAETIMTGELPSTWTCQGFDELPPEALTIPDVLELVKRTVRMNDCVQYLQETR